MTTWREVEWRDLADTAIVFVRLDTLRYAYHLIWMAGLFVALLAGLLVFLIPHLQPNSIDIAMDVLTHILNNSATQPALHFCLPLNESPHQSCGRFAFLSQPHTHSYDAFLTMLVSGRLCKFGISTRRSAEGGYKSSSNGNCMSLSPSSHPHPSRIHVGSSLCSGRS